MYAVIAVPFFDSTENKRAGCTMKCLEHLARTIQAPHVVIPVDNGSQDKGAVGRARELFETVLIMPEPLSIAGGVNSAWHLHHDALMAGEALAVKHDSDLTTWPDDGRWVDEIIRLFTEDPNVYLAGVRAGTHSYNTGGWTRVDHGWWIEAKFVYGGVQVRSPECFKALGYSRQPHGRWGYGDHWDAWRVEHLGKKLGVIKEYYFRPEVGHSALSAKYKKTNREIARSKLAQMKTAVVKGRRPVFEKFHAT